MFQSNVQLTLSAVAFKGNYVTHTESQRPMQTLNGQTDTDIVHTWSIDAQTRRHTGTQTCTHTQTDTYTDRHTDIDKQNTPSDQRPDTRHIATERTDKLDT